MAMGSPRPPVTSHRPGAPSTPSTINASFVSQFLFWTVIVTGRFLRFSMTYSLWGNPLVGRSMVTRSFVPGYCNVTWILKLLLQIRFSASLPFLVPVFLLAICGGYFIMISGCAPGCFPECSLRTWVKGSCLGALSPLCSWLALVLIPWL
ncbi:hypothetical protein CPC08DRAFT_465475 [Agrocybe pediades]|nr:hypothetical protein CPC08DRAFT_465475 [Agrocybe pediades]